MRNEHWKFYELCADNVMSASSYLIIGIVQMLYVASRARKESNLKELYGWIGAWGNRNVLPFWRQSQQPFSSTVKLSIGTYYNNDIFFRL